MLPAADLSSVDHCAEELEEEQGTAEGVLDKGTRIQQDSAVDEDDSEGDQGESGDDMDDDGDNQDNTEGEQGAAKGPQLFSSNVEAQEILQVSLCGLSLQPLHCIPDSTPHSIAQGGAWRQRSIRRSIRSHSSQL